MLVTLKEILEVAEAKGIAVGAFNAPNYEALQAVMAAAEETQLPVIVQVAQVHESLMPMAEIGPVMLAAAKKAKVPVCVHLDHGEDFEFIQKALDLGFTGVMYDGSTLPYEENLANARQVVKMAAKTGASVEAELGSMGKREGGAGESADDKTKIYTNPEQASGFINDSGIDALACSFGTTHGIYLSEPKLDFGVVKNVRAKANKIPVVMHGGSGVSKGDFTKAIKAGVRKINYFTYMDKDGGAAAAKYLNGLSADEPIFFSEIAIRARDAMKENVIAAMKMFALQR